MLIKEDVFNFKQTPPSNLIPWLIHQNSLTQKLKILAGNARLQVLGQRLELADLWDKQKLNLHAETILHREIIMWAWDKPCWYARTIMPQATFKNKLFSRLNNESLGELIFDEDAKIKRTFIKHYAITEQSIEYNWFKEFLSVQIIKKLWVRLSEFVVEDDFPFVLLEILLPDLQRYCH